MTIDDVLENIRAGLNLEAEIEYELLTEIRGHLEEAVEAARARGMDEETALADAAARFGVDDVAEDLQATHVGWGTLEGVAAAALPVLLALVLRWVVFAPDGTAVGWREMLTRPLIWSTALITLLVPILKFPRRRHALIAWAVFWVLSLLIVFAPASRW